MSLYESPERHAENPPESWEVRREQSGSRVVWQLWIDPQAKAPVFTYATRKEAEAAKREGYYFTMWHKEARWYAGESIPQWRPYAVIAAERAQSEARKRREFERIGMSEELHDTIQKLARTRIGDDNMGAFEDAVTMVTDWLHETTLYSLSDLNHDEAADLHHEIGEQWGFTTYVGAELHRVKYLGVGADRSALEVLEDLAQQEADMTASDTLIEYTKAMTREDKI